MATNSTTNLNGVTAVLKFPTSLHDFIIFVKAIYKSMLGNAYFPASAPKLVLLNTDIITLDASDLGCSTTPKTVTVQKRNADKVAVVKLVHSLRMDVQTVADANPLIAVAIIKSAGMKVGIFNARGKQQNTAVNGDEEGTIIATGEGEGQHNWRTSPDNTTWTVQPSSKGGKTIFKNCISGQLLYIQNCLVPAFGETAAWSQSVKIRVN